MAKDYPQKVVKEHIDKVVFGKQPTRKDTSEQGVPFVATYLPKRKDLDKLIKIYNFSYTVIARLKKFFHQFL